jgi:hypothetical protein
VLMKTAQAAKSSISTPTLVVSACFHCKPKGRKTLIVGNGTCALRLPQLAQPLKAASIGTPGLANSLAHHIPPDVIRTNAAN